MLVKHFVWRVEWLLVALGFVTILATPAAAQNRSAGRIDGIVTDESQAVLPGVTVTVTSPALQVPQLTTVTDAEGVYRFLDLPVGTYRLQYELSGFTSAIREGLVLTAGFAARVNQGMKIGSMAESITVTGASPIVDVSTTSGGQTISTASLLKELPGSGTIADIVSLSPGLINTAGQTPGGLGLNGRPRFQSYGIQSGNTNSTMMVDGMPVIVNNPLPDVSATQEVDVRTFGNGADVREPGLSMNLVIKSGGNEFHGGGSGSFMKQPSSNIDGDLRARNFTVASQMRYFSDVGGDLSGRIIRDKLWFYVGARKRNNEQTLPGMVLNAGPDGVFKTGDEPPAYDPFTGENLTTKIAYQMTRSYGLHLMVQRDHTVDNASGGGPNRPFPSTSKLVLPPRNNKIEFKGTPNPMVFLNFIAGDAGYDATYYPNPLQENVPQSTDRATGLNWGHSNNSRTSLDKIQTVNASATILPPSFLGGHHEFKGGYYWLRRLNRDRFPNRPYGNYTLTFDGGVPAEFVAMNSPVDPKNRDDMYSLYVSDSWRIGQRLTFNVGLRWDGQHSYVPEQSREQGQWPFTAPQKFSKVEVLTYSAWAPRAAAAYDVTGTGHTVIKATYGRYNPSASLSSGFNANSSFSNTYVWRDLDGNKDYTPGEIDFVRDFLSSGSPQFDLLNPDLKLPNVDEYTVSAEQQLAANTSIRGLYLRRLNGNRTGGVNALRPYGIYNIALSRLDPGPDGVIRTADDGGMVTIYDYDAKYRAAAFQQNQTQNAPDDVKNNWSQSYEVAFTKRQGTLWSATASYSANNFRNFNWALTPNNQLFPETNTWTWSAKLNGNLNLPHEIALGAIVEILDGVQGERTYIFRAADPLGGPALRGLSTVTVQLEPAGSQQEPAYALFNLRASKRFHLDARRQLQLSIDGLNLFNANAPTAVTYASGPTFRNVTNAVAPRNIRAGVSFTF